MDEIATTRPPAPPQGTGAMYVRVYGVTPDGVEYPLPPDVPPVPGQCIVPGCDCGGVEVEE